MSVLVKRKYPKSIVAMGNSLTYNGRYESTLLTALGAGWTIANKGVNGNKTSDMLTRFNADVVALGPGYVILWGGINDIFNSIVNTTSNLTAMYAAAAAVGIKVIALNLSPCAGVSYDSETAQANLVTVNNWINAMPANVDWLVDVHTVLEDPANLTHLLAAYDSGDHLHLSNAGYDAVAAAIYAEVWA
jgi:lysophospholipase L1-like esterase